MYKINQFNLYPCLLIVIHLVYAKILFLLSLSGYRKDSKYLRAQSQASYTLKMFLTKNVFFKH